MDGLFTFLESIFVKNPVLEKDHKKLLAAIKDGACSVSEAPRKVTAPGVKRSSK
jgi:hypothetical protein